MYNVVIVEDEPLARRKLKRLLQDLPETIHVVAELTSLIEVEQFLASGQRPDIIFSDIELSDGNVFQVYQQKTPPCPVIFITAYDQFMLQAFESFGIGYLLKPYNLEKLQQAWQKYCQLSSKEPQAMSPDSALTQLQAMLASLPTANAVPRYISRIAIRQQQQIYFLQLDDLVWLQADGGLLLGYDQFGKRHFLPYSSLQAFLAEVDPACFYRINRSEVVQLNYIERLERYCKNTLSVVMKPLGVQLKTSQSRTGAFNSWLGI